MRAWGLRAPHRTGTDTPGTVGPAPQSGVAGSRRKTTCSTRKPYRLEWGGKTLTLETGRIARQADGAVLATYGETVVLCAVTAAKSVKEGQDFFPLTVHYQEKFFAAGKIPGGFFKREGRPTEKETLASRLIDRPIRPLFPDGFHNETQIVIARCCATIGENEPDIVAMIAASAALTHLGRAVHGPDRRRARRLHRRRVHAQPDARRRSPTTLDLDRRRHRTTA